MGKPIGIDSLFQVVRPTVAEDEIWNAVLAAIIGGMTPQQFKEEAAQAWEQILRDQAKEAVKVLSK